MIELIHMVFALLCALHNITEEIPCVLIQDYDDNEEQLLRREDGKEAVFAY